MPRAAILLPCFAMVVITAIVWVKLYIDRLGEMRARNILPQSLADSRAAAGALANIAAADNFRNLFEIPVLFYALCAALATGSTVSPGFVYAAWAFVALRAVHSYVHLTYNQVTHRFAAYALSTLIVFVMWVAFGVQLLRA